MANGTARNALRFMGSSFVRLSNDVYKRQQQYPILLDIPTKYCNFFGFGHGVDHLWPLRNDVRVLEQLCLSVPLNLFPIMIFFCENPHELQHIIPMKYIKEC